MSWGWNGGYTHDCPRRLEIGYEFLPQKTTLTLRWMFIGDVSEEKSRNCVNEESKTLYEYFKTWAAEA